MKCFGDVRNVALKYTYTRDDEPLEDRCDSDAMTSIPFFDNSCSIIEGRIDTDMFKKKLKQTETIN